eukprot:gnl/MRDRNA2_/MRDRNA2_95958_c0_seq1.p1 gnl/MRDRNA2_/MRDRNA2_95958_c0~~gnl/MRDRNA2_/MRDRNA2_95958_c0_seq1.p1  ORF type:complete len:869 (+),score=223.65 gnl/MRDRNA2_/MRDRNA2_95958_c0_seq1:73-2679(+)
MASRIIVKNLPKHATDERLREHFAECGEITDCRVQKTREGKTRQFAFVGFRKEEEARDAIKRLNRSFVDTSRISVELAHAPGATAPGVRPWSKYSVGSSAHDKRNRSVDAGSDADLLTSLSALSKGKGKTNVKSQTSKHGNNKGKPQKSKTKSVQPPLGSTAKAIQVTNVDFQKAGVAATRTKIEFASESDESEGEYNIIGLEKDDSEAVEHLAQRESDDLAFDEDVDDLAWMKSKTAKNENGKMLDEVDCTASDSEDELDEEGQEEEGTLGEAAEKDCNDEKSDDDEKDTSVVDERKAGVQSLSTDSNAMEAMPAPDAGDTGRLFVTNLPYGATEDELRSHFEPLGDIASIHVCRDENTLRSRGFAYVSYVFPEIAVRAISELDGQFFQGRLLHVNAAHLRPETKLDADTLKTKDMSFKKRREAQKKKVDSKLPHTWNLLYVSANAAADVMSSQLGIAKSDLIGRDAEGAAVTAALGETHVIQETKQWLKKEGVSLEAFERTGTSLLGSKVSEDVARRDDTLLVKHLPADSSIVELRDRFGRYGELVKCSLAPTNTVAVVQYGESSHAKRAFEKLAFSRYKHVPLYLEWAPDSVFVENAKVPSGDAQKESEKHEPDEDSAEICSVFVKNLNFSTTDAGLKAAFASCKGLRSAKVMRKKSAKGANAAAQGEGLSMGYGFLEFDTAVNAKEAIKRKQNALVDGHTLNLQVSQRSASGKANEGAAKKGGKSKAGALSSSRICVRNLAFEATGKELRKLFGVYGTVTAVRIPKKGDYSGHRGFAFIDFLTKSDAAASMEALQHTHLYGRHLVIEPAEDQNTDVISVQEAAQKREASKTAYSEAKKRRRSAVLNTSGTQGADNSFEDAFGVD